MIIIAAWIAGIIIMMMFLFKFDIPFWLSIVFCLITWDINPAFTYMVIVMVIATILGHHKEN